MDHGGRGLYHVNIDPLREVENTLHITTSSLEYRLTWVVNVPKCSFGSEVPSYLSMFREFHVMGRGVSIMSSTKGCQ